jgi:hypothetical protein
MERGCHLKTAVGMLSQKLFIVPFITKTSLVPFLYYISTTIITRIVQSAFFILEVPSSIVVYDVVIGLKTEAMTSYNIEFKEGILQMNFGEPAQNNQIVGDAAAHEGGFSHEG